MLNPATRQRYGRRTRDCGSVPSTSFSPAPSAYRLVTSCLALKYTLMLKMLYALPPKLTRHNPAQLCTRRTPPSPLLSAPSPSSPFHSLSRSRPLSLSHLPSRPARTHSREPAFRPSPPSTFYYTSFSQPRHTSSLRLLELDCLLHAWIWLLRKKDLILFFFIFGGR